MGKKRKGCYLIPGLTSSTHWSVILIYIRTSKSSANTSTFRFLLTLTVSHIFCDRESNKKEFCNLSIPGPASMKPIKPHGKKEEKVLSIVCLEWRWWCGVTIFGKAVLKNRNICQQVPAMMRVYWWNTVAMNRKIRVTDFGDGADVLEKISLLIELPWLWVEGWVFSWKTAMVQDRIGTYVALISENANLDQASNGKAVGRYVFGQKLSPNR